MLNRIDPTWIVNDKVATEELSTGHFVSRQGAPTRADLILPPKRFKLLYYREYWGYGLRARRGFILEYCGTISAEKRRNTLARKCSCGLFKRVCCLFKEYLACSFYCCFADRIGLVFAFFLQALRLVVSISHPPALERKLKAACLARFLFQIESDSSAVPEAKHDLRFIRSGGVRQCFRIVHPMTLLGFRYQIFQTLERDQQ